MAHRSSVTIIFLGLLALACASPASAANTARTAANAASTPADAVGTANWAQPGYSKNDTGFNPVEKTITVANVVDLHVKWSVQVASDESCARMAPPLILDGRVFLTDNYGIGAYNQTTGVRLWHKDDPHSPTNDTTPMIIASGDSLITSERHCSGSPTPFVAGLTAYNTATGKIRWQNNNAYAATWIIDGNVLVTSSGDFGGTTPFNLSTGRKVWGRSDKYAHNAVGASGNVLLTRDDGKGAVALNVKTGQPAWNTTTPWQAVSGTVDGSHFVTVTASGMIAYVNAKTGKARWTVPTVNGLSCGSASCPFSADTAHVYAPEDNGVTALSLVTGAQVWHTGLDADLSRPIVANGIVYINAADQGATAMTASSGTLLGLSLPEPEVGYPVVVGGKLFITDGFTLNAYGMN